MTTQLTFGQQTVTTTTETVTNNNFINFNLQFTQVIGGKKVTKTIPVRALVTTFNADSDKVKSMTGEQKEVNRFLENLFNTIVPNNNVTLTPELLAEVYAKTFNSQAELTLTLSAYKLDKENDDSLTFGK